MALDAIAVLRVPHARIVSALPPNAGDAPDTLRNAGGEAFRATPFEDGTFVHTALPFGSEPDELGLRLRQLLGDLLDLHDDSRGVKVFPDVAKPHTRTYDTLLDEIGDLGFWVPLVPEGHVPAHAGGAVPAAFEDSLRDLMSAIPAGTMADLQRAVMSGDEEAFRRAGEALQGVLAGHQELVEALQQSLAGVMQGEDEEGEGEDEGEGTRRK